MFASKNNSITKNIKLKPKKIKIIMNCSHLVRYNTRLVL